MKPLIKKEIRLLGPAYGMALLLAVLPVWLLPRNSTDQPETAAIPLFCFGAVMLALSVFGREFGLRTFPLLLAQPLERRRIWWTKTGLLAGAMATIFAAWCLSCVISVHVGPGRAIGRETLTIGGTAAVVTFAGGLWTTLLLRQITAAFWFTILVPGLILVVIGLSGGTEPVKLAALGLYSVAGFLWAWRQFLRAQDTAWTGGVITLPGWGAAKAASRASIRSQRPLAALFWKELQLHQVGLIGMVWLLILHLGIVALRKAGHQAFGNGTRTALEIFGAIWLAAPLLIGSTSTAEERKLGTMEGLLCLPIPRRAQFGLKLFFVLLLGGMLSALLPWTAEGIASAMGAGSPLDAAFNNRTLAILFLLSFGLSVIAFYASTLARNIMQALAASVFITLAVWLMVGLASGPVRTFGVRLWSGALVHCIVWPTLAAAFLWLAWRNFRCVSESWRLWCRNLLGVAGALAFGVGLTALLYNRAWELLTPLEPAHGPALLTGAQRPELKSDGANTLLGLFPDGRLWVDRIARGHLQFFLSSGPSPEMRLPAGGKWISRSQFIADSNWVDGVPGFFETVAIRSDGTLWVSEKPYPAWDLDRGVPLAPKLVDLVRFGNESSWQSVARDYWELSSVILLKQDGTLWLWGTNFFRESFREVREWPGLRAFEPRRLGTESDWARIDSALGSVYACKKDGRAFVLHKRIGRQPRAMEVEPGIVIERLPGLDNFKWRSMAQCWPSQIAVREDGTLWAWTAWWTTSPPLQIGKDTNWTAVAGDYWTLAALKSDGSLWKWDLIPGRTREADLAATAPARLGTHNDWVAVSAAWNGTVSLAADGTLWYWWDRNPFHYYRDPAGPLLTASRKPAKIDNLFTPRGAAVPGN